MSILILSFVLIFPFLLNNILSQNISNIVSESIQIDGNYSNYIRRNNLTIIQDDKCIVLFIKLNFSEIEFILNPQNERNSLIRFSKDEKSVLSFNERKNKYEHQHIVSVEIFNLTVAEIVLDKFYDIENWFFISVCTIHQRVFIYSENLKKNLILSKNFKGLKLKDIQFNNITIFSQKNVEISKFSILNSYIDFYNSTIRDSFMKLYPFSKVCDSECLKCEQFTGMCLECSSGKIPLNNSCPMSKTQIILKNYYAFNETFINKFFQIKDYLKNGITNFISFNYTITFYFSTIGNISYTQNSNQMNVFSIYNTKKLQTNLTYELIITNNTLFLKYYDIMRNQINFKDLCFIDEYWRNVILSHSVFNNQLTIFILDQCDKIVETHIIDYIILVPLDYFSSIKIGGNREENRYIGYLFDLSFYSNKLFDQKTIQIIRDLYSNITNENNQCASPIIKQICGKHSYSVNNSPNSSCVKSKYIEMKQLDGAKLVYLPNKATDLTLDFWFFVNNVDLSFEIKIFIYFSVYLKINPMNIDTIDIKCEQNMNIPNYENKAFILRAESKTQMWNYVRCSVSNTILDFNLISNNQKLNQEIIFGKKVFSYGNIEISVSKYKGFAYLRELRYFRMYFDKNLDIRYIKSDIDTVSNLAYVKIDYFKSSQVINEEKFNGEIFLPNSFPGYYLEQLLPNDIPDIPLCEDKDSIFFNNTCIKNFKVRKERECLVYDEEGYCLQCGSGKYLFNKTCVEYCPIDFIEYFKICYPCKKDCDLNNMYMLVDCESCKKRLSIKHIQYSSTENILDRNSFPLNQLAESKDNFIIEILLFIPNLYNDLDNKEYLFFSLLPFQLSINNSLLLIKYFNNDRDSIILDVTSIDFNRWNHFIFEQNSKEGKIHIYLNTFKINSYDLTSRIKNSLDLNDLLINYNYSLSYFKFLRIWGKIANINMLLFYRNYNFQDNPLNKPKQLIYELSYFYRIKDRSASDVYLFNYCKEGEFLDFSSITCRECPENCNECYQEKCFKCNEGYSIQKGECKKNNEFYYCPNLSSNLNITSVPINFNKNLTIGMWVKIIDLIKESEQQETLFEFSPFAISLSAQQMLYLNHKQRVLITHDYTNFIAKWNLIYFSMNSTSLSFTIDKLKTHILEIDFDRNYTINNILFGNRMIYFIQSLVITNQIFEDINIYINNFVFNNFNYDLLLTYFHTSQIKQEFYEYISKTTYNNSIKLLSNDLSFDICGEGFYYDNPSRKCIECNQNCKSCKEFNTCTSCSKNSSLKFYLNPTSNECVNNCKSDEIVFENNCQVSQYIDFNNINNFDTSFPINYTIFDTTLEIWVYIPYLELLNITLDLNSQISLKFIKNKLEDLFVNLSCSLEEIEVSVNAKILFGFWKNVKCSVKSNEQYLYLNENKNSIISPKISNFKVSSSFNSLYLRFIQNKYKLGNSFFLRNLRIWNIFIDEHFDSSKMNIIYYYPLNTLVFQASFTNITDILLTNHKFIVNSNYNSIFPNYFHNLSLCAEGEFYKDGNCLKSQLKISNCLFSMDGYSRCFKCDSKFFYDEETSLCVSKCKSNSYEDKLNKICRKCHKNCLRCYGPNENNCLECPLFPFNNILNSTTCIRNCQNDEIFIYPLSNCIKVSNCIKDVFLDSKDIYDLSTDYLIILNLIINNCLDDKYVNDNLDFIWKDTYSGLLLNLNQTLILPIENVKSYTLDFEINVYYRKILLTRVFKTIYFKNFTINPILSIKDSDSYIFDYGNNITIDSSLTYDEFELFNDVNVYNMSFYWEIEDKKISYNCINRICSKIMITFIQYFEEMKPGSKMKVKIFVTNTKHNRTFTKSSYIIFRSTNKNLLDLQKSYNKVSVEPPIEIKKVSVLSSPMVIKSNIDTNLTASFYWKQENIYKEFNSICSNSNFIIFTCLVGKDIKSCLNSDFYNNSISLNCSSISNSSYDLSCDPDFSLKLLKYYFFSTFNKTLTKDKNMVLETMWFNDFSKYVIGEYLNFNKTYLFIETSENGNKYISNQTNLDKILINTSESILNNTRNSSNNLDKFTERFMLICSKSEEFNTTYYISCLYYVTNVSCIVANSKVKEEELLSGRALQSKDYEFKTNFQNEKYFLFNPYLDTIDNSYNYTISLNVNENDIYSKYLLNFTYMKPNSGICRLSPTFFIAFNSSIIISSDYWKSENLPLSYRVFISDVNNLSYFIEEGFNIKNEIKFPNFFPNFTKIYLDVIDNKGITNRFLCISKDTSFMLTSGKLDGQMFINLFDPFKKLELCYYLSTFRLLSNDEVNTFYINFVKVIQHVKSSDNKLLFLKNKYTFLIKILIDYQIIRQYSKRDKSIEIYIDFLQIIVEKIDNYIYSEDLIKIVYSYINEIVISSKSILNNNQTLRYVSLKNNFNYNVLKNASPTISFTFRGKDFQVLMFTFSINNIKKISLYNEYKMDLPNSTIWDNCGLSSNFCLDTSETIKIFQDYKNYDIIRIFIDYSNNNIFPISFIKQESIMSGSILNLEVYGILKESNLLEFESIDFKKDFTINSLISFNLNNNTTYKYHYSDSACVQIDSFLQNHEISNYKICETWFYRDFIFCSCSNKGTTFTIIDKEIAKKSRSIQFPILDHITIFMISVVVFFTINIPFLLVFIIAMFFDCRHKDIKENKEFYLLKDFYYFKFHKEIKFFAVFSLLLDKLNPNIYYNQYIDSIYNRKFNIIRIFVLITIGLILSILPYYLIRDSDKTNIIFDRNIVFSRTDITDIPLNLSVIIIASLISILAIILANVIFWQIMSQFKEQPMILEIKNRMKMIQNTIYLQKYNKKYWYKKLMSTIKKIMVCTVLTEQVRKSGKLPKKNKENVILINQLSLNKNSSSYSNDYQKIDTNSHSPSTIGSPTKSRDYEYLYPLNSTKRNLISNRSIEMTNRLEIANSQNDSISNIEQHIKLNNEISLIKGLDSNLPPVEEKDEYANVKNTEEISNFSYQHTFNKEPLIVNEEENDDTILLKNRIIFNEDITKQFKVCEKDGFTLYGNKNFKKYKCRDIHYSINEGERKFLFPYLLSKSNYSEYVLNCFIIEIKSISINKFSMILTFFVSLFKYLFVISLILASWIAISLILQSLLIEYGYRILYLWLIPNLFINLFKFLIWDQAVLLFFVIIFFKNMKHFLKENNEKNKDEKKEKTKFLLGLLPESTKILLSSILEFKELYKEIEEKKR